MIVDPHQIANVHGLDGIRYMVESSTLNPLSVFVMLPSAVPASPMETAGAELSADDLAPLLEESWALDIAEMMNYPGVVGGDPAVLDKIPSPAASHEFGCRLHAPFMALSFLALPVIPELKLTDKGLVDVRTFQLVSMFEEGA